MKTNRLLPCAPGSAAIWKVSVEETFHYLFSRYRQILPQSELAKASFFYQQGDRNSYLTRRILSRLLLSAELGCRPEEIEFKEGENKKPYLASHSGTIHFNISHSGDQVLIGISPSLIGVDIEQVKPALDFWEVMNQYFTLAEQEAILKQYPKSKEAFYWLWTRKEAYLKYTGEGLLGDLQDIPPLLDGEESEDFVLKSPYLVPGFTSSLVYCREINRLNFYSFHPDGSQAFCPDFYHLSLPAYK